MFGAGSGIIKTENGEPTRGELSKQIEELRRQIHQLQYEVQTQNPEVIRVTQEYAELTGKEGFHRNYDRFYFMHSDRSGLIVFESFNNLDLELKRLKAEKFDACKAKKKCK